MAWLWLVAVSGWVIAVGALLVARRALRKTAQLDEQYWELKYGHGELKTRVRAIAPTPEEVAAAQPRPSQAFVPLSSVKRAP